MDTETLKELIKKYGLPLEVKKKWWFGDYFFRAETKDVAGTVSGSIFQNGSFHQVKSFPESEMMVLCHERESAQKQAQIASPELNPNGLDTDKSHYVRGVTKIYVDKKGSLKQAYFDRFELKNGRDVIYVTLEGESKPTFYGFPSKYLFPNKDDAEYAIDRANRKKAQAGSTTSIACAFCHLPLAEKVSDSVEEEARREKAYHKKVDEKLCRDLVAPKEDIQDAEQTLAYKQSALCEEMIAARENGYMVDDHTFISHSLSADKENRRISKAKSEIARIDRIKRKPYFARIDCGDSKHSLHTAYIGDNDIDEYVVDWRQSDIGNAYYHSSLYMNRDDAFLALKRIITIENAIFQGYVDEINRYSEKGVGQANIDYSKNSDALLERLLAESRIDKKTHDIIKTIQEEQYDIITSDFRKNAVINGCAGSGKTMILYHRLSYMAYNFKSVVGREFNPERVYIISPSRLFDSSNNELMKKLAIDTVRQSPFDEQIESLIGEYCIAHEIPQFHRLSKHLAFDKTSTVDPISDSSFSALISRVKAVGRDEQITTEYRGWLLNLANVLLEHNGFPVIETSKIPQSETELLQLFDSPKYFCSAAFVKKNQPNTNSLDESNTPKSANKETKYYSPSLITTISYENITRSLDYLIKQRETYSARMRRIERNKDFLLISLSSKTKLNSKADVSWNISEFWSLVDNATAFEKMLRLITIRKILISLFLPQQSEIDFILRCLFVVQKYFCNSSLQDVNLYVLQALSQKYGEVIEEESLIFIDEFQNYSPFEIACLKSAFVQPVFNLYGDYDQRIEDKGVDLRAKIKALLDPNSYNLTINYRNARQITDYINKTVHKNMQSIGVDGSVMETSITDCLFEVKDRTAIICKDKKQVQRFLSRRVDANQINDVSQSGRLKEGQFNLSSVQECKGLEFDTVYVIDFDMSENEKYVAYTRALDHLIIITDNLIELLNHENEEKRREEERRKTEKIKEKEEKNRKQSECHAKGPEEKENHATSFVSVLAQASEQRTCAEVESQEKDVLDDVTTEVQNERTSDNSGSEDEDTINKSDNISQKQPDSNKDRVSEKEERLEAEIARLSAYCEELRLREVEKQEEEQKRKRKLYELAIEKIQTGTPELLREAIYLLETIADYADSTEQMILAKMKVEQIAAAEEDNKKSFRSQNLCQYCGGSFRGFGKKYCRNCGKRKDY